MYLKQHAAAAKSLQSCLTLYDPIDGSPPGSPVPGTQLQYSCLENPMDGGAWYAAVHGVGKSRTRPSDFTFTFHFHALEREMATHSSVFAWSMTIPKFAFCSLQKDHLVCMQVLSFTKLIFEKYYVKYFKFSSCKSCFLL